MAARKQGQHKTMQEKAQEDVDRQQKIVDRLESQLNETEKKIRDLRIQVSNEREFLAYYKANPALKGEITGAAKMAGVQLSGQLSIDDDVEWHKNELQDAESK